MTAAAKLMTIVHVREDNGSWAVMRGREESLGYFRELLEKDLPADYLVRSDFAVINQRLATHYDLPGVVGCQVRRVALPAGHFRGPFLTQAAVLKVTANGTTTSPVPRGAFVLDRLLREGLSGPTLMTAFGPGFTCAGLLIAP